MATLKEFLDSNKKSTSLTLLPGPKLAATIQSSLVSFEANQKHQLVNNNKEASKDFSNKLSNLIQSDEFMQQLSDKVGQPLKTESENEFVDRAKNTMRKIILSKLEK